jgi:hypothetical protein
MSFYEEVDGVRYERLLPHHKSSLVNAIVKARTIHNIWPHLLKPENAHAFAQHQVDTLHNNWARTEFALVAVEKNTGEVVGYDLGDDFAYFDPTPPPPTGNELADIYRGFLTELYAKLYAITGPVPPRTVVAATIGIGVVPEYNSRGVYTMMKSVLRAYAKKQGFQYILGPTTHSRTFKAHVPYSLVTHTIFYEEYCYEGKFPFKGVVTGSVSMILAVIPGVQVTYKFPSQISTLNNGVQGSL